MKIFRYSVKELLIFTRAYIYALFFEIIIRILPFKYILKFFIEDKVGYKEELTSEDFLFFKTTLKRVKKYSFCKCLALAITGRCLLRSVRVSSSLFMGLKKESGELKAHAWLKCNDKYICGFLKGENFTEIAKY